MTPRSSSHTHIVALWALAEESLATGDVEDSLRCLRAVLDDEGGRLYPLTEARTRCRIAEVLLEYGTSQHLVEALTHLRQAMLVVKDVPAQSALKLRMLEKMAWIYEQDGDWIVAHNTLERAMDEAHALPDGREEYCIRLWLQHVRLFVDEGKWEEGLQWAIRGKEEASGPLASIQQALFTLVIIHINLAYGDKNLIGIREDLEKVDRVVSHATQESDWIDRVRVYCMILKAIYCVLVYELPDAKKLAEQLRNIKECTVLKGWMSQQFIHSLALVLSGLSQRFTTSCLALWETALANIDARIDELSTRQGGQYLAETWDLLQLKLTTLEHMVPVRLAYAEFAKAARDLAHVRQTLDLLGPRAANRIHVLHVLTALYNYACRNLKGALASLNEARHEEVVTASNLLRVVVSLGPSNLEEATIKHCDDTLSDMLRPGDGPLLQSVVQFLLGVVRFLRGFTTQAKRFLRDSLIQAKRIHHEQLISIILTLLGTLYTSIGDDRVAERMLRAALTISTRRGDLLSEIECLMSLQALFHKSERTHDEADCAASLRTKMEEYHQALAQGEASPSS